MSDVTYEKSKKYPDLATVYTECSGPGGLKLTEFLAEKMSLRTGAHLLDIGIERGFQTCFLAKEYQVFAVGIDPGLDRHDHLPHVDHLMRNARAWGVQDRVLGIGIGVPDTKFASNSFDFVYSTTTLEMIRGMFGTDAYRQSIAEVLRVLRPGGIFGLGEPMHRAVTIPADLAPIYTQGKGMGPEGWAACFATAAETADVVQAVGFEVLEAGDAPDATLWWEEYCQHDPFCKTDPGGEPRIIRQDGGRWLTYGYVIARKPE
jgi:SAM-dependent methyltransferase